MHAKPADYVIVGAGHAAGRAAETLVALGLGERLVVIGEEGFAPYERPAVSKELLSGGLDQEQLLVRPTAWYADHGVRLRLGTRATALDLQARRVTLADGSAVDYGRLLLTLGARARPLPAPLAAAGAHLIRGIDDALALRSKLRPGLRCAVIGGGFIGLEVAAALAKAQCQVTLLEAASALLGRVGPAVLSAHMADLHRARGVDVRLGVQVRAVEKTAACTRLQLSDGQWLEADEVVAGIGAIPNTALAAEAGLQVEDGIVTDAYGRSSDPQVFAAGDVSSHFNPILGRRLRLESWQNAQNQAIAVARSMAGIDTAHAEVPWFWTDQHDCNVQFAGVPTSWQDLVVRGDPASGRFVLLAIENDQVSGAIAVNSGREMRFLRQLIACARPVDRVRLADSQERLDKLLESMQAPA